MTEEKEMGLYVKYEVRKVGGGGYVDNCFVLRPDRDPAARVALLAYADATENARLGEELRVWVKALENGVQNVSAEAGDVIRQIHSKLTPELYEVKIQRLEEELKQAIENKQKALEEQRTTFLEESKMLKQAIINKEKVIAEQRQLLDDKVEEIQQLNLEWVEQQTQVENLQSIENRYRKTASLLIEFLKEEV